jgi:hypothetical protein
MQAAQDLRGMEELQERKWFCSRDIAEIEVCSSTPAEAFYNSAVPQSI